MPTENRSTNANIPPVIGETPLGGSYYAVECTRCGWVGSSEELTDDCQCTQPEGEHVCLGHTDEIGPERLMGIVQAMAKQSEQHQGTYPPCDYCGIVPDYHPWHGSGLLKGIENRHIHACDGCRGELPAHLERRQGQTVLTLQLPDPLDDRDGPWFDSAEIRALAKFPAGTKLYLHPDTGEVERLRAEVKRLDLLVSQGDHDYDMYRVGFDRQLAERDALLRKAWRGPRTDEDCAAIDAALSASEKPSTPASCTWTYNNNSFAWDTTCANSFTLMEDGPKENGMKFCPYCSKPILQVPHDTES